MLELPAPHRDLQPLVVHSQLAASPIKTMPPHTFILQSPQGTRRELLRALCQLVNTTSLTLEAALIEVEDSDWHVVAARSGGLPLTFTVRCSDPSACRENSLDPFKRRIHCSFRSP